MVVTHNTNEYNDRSKEGGVDIIGFDVIIG